MQASEQVYCASHRSGAFCQAASPSLTSERLAVALSVLFSHCQPVPGPTARLGVFCCPGHGAVALAHCFQSSSVTHLLASVH